MINRLHKFGSLLFADTKICVLNRKPVQLLRINDFFESLFHSESGVLAEKRTAICIFISHTQYTRRHESARSRVILFEAAAHSGQPIPIYSSRDSRVNTLYATVHPHKAQG